MRVLPARRGAGGRGGVIWVIAILLLVGLLMLNNIDKNLARALRELRRR